MYDLANPLGPGQARNPVEGQNDDGYLAQYFIQSTAALGAVLPVGAQYRMCDNDVMNRFVLSGDYYEDFTKYYKNLLAEPDIRVLIYAVRLEPPLHLHMSSHFSCTTLCSA